MIMKILEDRKQLLMKKYKLKTNGLLFLKK